MPDLTAGTENHGAPPLAAGRFSIDDMTPYFDGFDEPGKRWNGWRMPFFAEPVMLQVKAHLNSDPGFSQGEGATVIGHHPEKPPAERFTLTEGEYAGTVHAVSLDGVWLWALGDGWCWTAEKTRQTIPRATTEPLPAEAARATSAEQEDDLGL
jgi:hypothetical protein